MGENLKKRQEKIWQREMKILEELEKSWEERGEEQRRRIDFIEGVALIYGIIGNLFVQH